MPKPLKKKRPTGACRMRALGKRQSQLWYTAEQYALVKRASAVVRRPMTTFAILATLKAARAVSRNPNDPDALTRPEGPPADDQET